MSDSLLKPVPRSRPVARYAPSPTGDLHLGNLRTALLAHADARRRGGIFVLRVEDIDAPRNVPGAEARILDDLRWIGIDWDEGPDVGGPAGPYRQSERGPFYEAALARLAAAGLVYPCLCSRRDLREASAPHGPEGPVYPGTCRGREMPKDGSRPTDAAIRFRIDREPAIEFDDAIRGRQRFSLPELCGDFVICRRDGLWAYQLACAVDDALMGVTDILRGADLVSSTPRQLALIRALRLPEPAYSHVPLVLEAPGGPKMSKRDGSASLRAWREAGMTREEARRRILALETELSAPDRK